ncbi:MAG: type II toxin-antitoxin system HicA family toxin [Treponema sp.]|nr:type II toxin-antitoxin system HicA family toxin [Treponema sp.]
MRADIEGLLTALGSEISEGSGSRLRVKLNGVRAVFHRPHPQKTTDKGAVLSVRRFLENAEARYEGSCLETEVSKQLYYRQILVMRDNPLNKFSFSN